METIAKITYGDLAQIIGKVLSKGITIEEFEKILLQEKNKDEFIDLSKKCLYVNGIIV